MMDDDNAAAWLLITMKHSLPPSTKQSVVEAIERESRVFIQVPRKKRSFRVPITYASSTSSKAMVDYVSKDEDFQETHIQEEPLMESPTKPTRNRKKLAPLSPPMETQPKKTKRRGNCRLAASSSSSNALVDCVSKDEDFQKTHIQEEPLMESPTKPTRNRKKRCPLSPPMETQPKKTKRSGNCRLAASSRTREPTPEWLLRLMASKNGVEPKKIIDKALNATDISSNHNRLSIPLSQIIDLEFLNLAEAKIIEEDVKKKRKKGVDAKLVSSDLREFDVNLRRWDMKKKKKKKISGSSLYNLVTGWNQVVEDCGLNLDDKIRLWSFHSNGELYFAFVPLPPPPPPPPIDSGESKSEEMSSALVICDKSSDDLTSK